MLDNRKSTPLEGTVDSTPMDRRACSTPMEQECSPNSNKHYFVRELCTVKYRLHHSMRMYSALPQLYIPTPIEMSLFMTVMAWQSKTNDASPVHFELKHPSSTSPLASLRLDHSHVFPHTIFLQPHLQYWWRITTEEKEITTGDRRITNIERRITNIDRGITATCISHSDSHYRILPTERWRSQWIGSEKKAILETETHTIEVMFDLDLTTILAGSSPCQTPFPSTAFHVQSLLLPHPTWPSALAFKSQKDRQTASGISTQNQIRQPHSTLVPNPSPNTLNNTALTQRIKAQEYSSQRHPVPQSQLETEPRRTSHNQSISKPNQASTRLRSEDSGSGLKAEAPTLLREDESELLKEEEKGEVLCSEEKLSPAQVVDEQHRAKDQEQQRTTVQPITTVVQPQLTAGQPTPLQPQPTPVQSQPSPLQLLPTVQPPPTGVHSLKGQDAEIESTQKQSQTALAVEHWKHGVNLFSFLDLGSNRNITHFQFMEAPLLPQQMSPSSKKQLAKMLLTR